MKNKNITSSLIKHVLKTRYYKNVEETRILATEENKVKCTIREVRNGTTPKQNKQNGWHKKSAKNMNSISKEKHQHQICQQWCVAFSKVIQFVIVVFGTTYTSIF